MVAKLLSSFRKGNLSEGLAVQLLRRFAAVATVPHEEDVGVDAVCTLLRVEGPRLYAEESFAVQIKSASDRRVYYNAEQERWFRTLNLPLFLASVSLREGVVELYSTEIAHKDPPQFNVGLILSLDPPDDDKVTEPPYESLSDGNVPCFWLGPPILRTTLMDADADGFAYMAYARLRPWLTLMLRSLRFRAFGIHQTVWAKPDQAPAVTAHRHGEGNLREVLAELDPLLWQLRGLLGHVLEEGPLRAELRALADLMKANGIERPLCDLYGI